MGRQSGKEISRGHEPPINRFCLSFRAGLVHPRVGDGLASRSDEIAVPSRGTDEVIRDDCLLRERCGCCGRLDSVDDCGARDSS